MTSTPVQPFTDLANSPLSAPAISALQADGWVVGVGQHQYKPFDTITRAQMAVFIVRAEQGIHFKPITPPIQEYDDVPLDYWAAGWIAAAGMDKYTDGKFYPRNPATRADIAILVHIMK